ncbi:LacI family DNA-binding transcriptional regulator [Neiella sp. HB171785]|uniref:LacI family DNA-binding transcriptional regulator n=1 Tax=Neiella litorisoli TaxID=2771431 RepID=A0A8J6QVG8_9GAMM|nr:LacI family DNA-binding transcriptional regulator [Neiella litorisoli]MBD1390478.1 LacI family DNA-binding transcriptional regulator [Neiella litorisoli]
MATIKDVAKLAGVSKATVSRVLNGNERVSQVARDKVKQAMSDLGYKPSALAQALATNRSRTIGMVVSDLSGPFFGPIMKSAERVIRDAGFQLVVTNGHGQADREREAIEFMTNRPVDALILTVFGFPEEEIVELHRNGTPIVLLNRHIPGFEDNCIYLDNEQGGYLATKRMLELGHTRIAFLAGHFTHHDSVERLEGYQRALAEFGVPFRQELVFDDDYNEDGGRRMCQKLLNLKREFTAMFCGNDLIAIGARDILNQNGLLHGTCMVGFDDVTFARYLNPSLSSVFFPVEEMGERAGHMALAMAGQRSESVGHILQPKLIERQSLCPLATTSD